MLALRQKKKGESAVDLQSLEHRCEYSVTLDGVAFYVFDAGKNAYRPEPYLGMLHNHYTCELHYIHEGKADIQIDGDRIGISEGELCFLGKSVYHHVYSAGLLRTSFNVEIGLVGTSGADEKNYRHIVKCLELLGDYRVFKDPYIASLMSASFNVAEGFAFPDMHRGLLMLGVFLRLVDIVAAENGIHLSDFGRMKRSRDFERKRVIEHHIEQCYALKNGLHELAGSLFLSEKQAGILVKKLMGESYKTLQTRQRLRIANRLMRGEKSLLQIASYVGYSSYNGFFVAYQKVFSISPEEARARIQAGEEIGNK